MAASVLSFSPSPHSPLFSLPLAQHPRSRAILRDALQLSPVLPFSSRGSLSLSHRRLSRVILRLYSPASPSPCVDLSPLPLADELRGNEREQGRSNCPSTETAFLSRPLRLSSSSLSSYPFPAVARKTLQCEMPSPCRTFRLALSPSIFLPFFVFLFISPVVARGPTFFHRSRSLRRSLLLPRSSFPRAVHSNSSLRKRFIDRHSRLFFPSDFFSPPRTFLAYLISRLFFSGRKSRVTLAAPYTLNTTACDQHKITCVTLRETNCIPLKSVKVTRSSRIKILDHDNCILYYILTLQILSH